MAPVEARRGTIISGQEISAMSGIVLRLTRFIW